MRHSVLERLSQLMASLCWLQAPSWGAAPRRAGAAQPLLSLPKAQQGQQDTQGQLCHSRAQKPLPAISPLEFPPPTLSGCVLLWAPQVCSVQMTGMLRRGKQDTKVLMTHFSNIKYHSSVLFLQGTPFSQALRRIHSHLFFTPANCYFFLPEFVYYPFKNYNFLLQELYSNSGIALF